MLMTAYLAVVLQVKVRSSTLYLVPHALHVMQIVSLVPIFSKHGSCLLCLLYLPSSELPLGSLTVHKPAQTVVRCAYM